MTPKHILIANNVYPPIMAGGAELIVAYLAEGLAAQGHRVTVVSTCGPEMEPYPVETRNGVEIIRFFPKNFYWSFTRGHKPAYQKALWHVRDAWNRDASTRFQTILAEKTPDLLHTHLIDGMSAVLWRRAKRAGIPVLHTAHDYHLLCPRAFMLTRSLALCTKPQIGCQVYRRWHLHTAQDVDLFTSPSQFLINKHIENGLRAKNTAVVRNGIPLPQVPPKQRDSHAPMRFLFPARLTIEKGCEVVLATLQYLPQDLNFELTVVGKGALEDKFTAAAAQDKRLRFMGYVSGEQKQAIFSQSDCLIIPSLWYENAPVVIVEAAAYGMGVIGSNIGAIPEFVKDQSTGLLFEPGNPQALAAAMIELIRNPSRLPAFAANAQSLLAECTVAKMVENYSAHYGTLLASKA
jgi:glycosyltransferase involved in cell wall biosynthesis